MMTFMRVGGGILAAVGVVLALLNFLMPGQMQVMGLTPEAAFTLLAGGMVAMGLGGVMAAIEAAQAGAAVHLPSLAADEPVMAAPAPVVVAAPEAAAPAEQISEPAPAPVAASAEGSRTAEERMAAFRRERFPGFSRHLGDAAGSTLTGLGTAAAATAATATAASASAHDSVADTIAALEKAKSDINAALGQSSDSLTDTVEEVEEVETAAAEAVAVEDEPAAGTEEQVADGELYVIEEKIIRGRPARVLSDGTVEAETDEGWMRFENLDHLDEYLDATAPELGV